MVHINEGILVCLKICLTNDKIKAPTVRENISLGYIMALRVLEKIFFEMVLEKYSKKSRIITLSVLEI